MKKTITTVVIIIAIIALLLGGWLAYKHYLNNETIPAGSKPQDLLKQIQTAATAGKTISSGRFHIGSTSTEIIRSWGEPSSKTMKKKELLQIGYDRMGGNNTPLFSLSSNKVSSIACHSARYNDIKYHDMIQALGQPAKEEVREGENGTFLAAIYQTGNYTLEINYDENAKDHNPNSRALFVEVK